MNPKLGSTHVAARMTRKKAASKAPLLGPRGIGILMQEYATVSHIRVFMWQRYASDLPRPRDRAREMERLDKTLGLVKETPEPLADLALGLELSGSLGQ
jgi:ABC-type sulfate/molybdate transport systems ATPase subunit